MKDVRGKVALITGGVSGIGLGIASVFAAAGMHVIVTYRREDHRDEALEWLAEDRNVRVMAMPLDVTDRTAVQRIADNIEAIYGKIHVLCNNAGVNQLGPLDEASHEDWDWILGVNLTGTFNMLKAFVPKIKRHGEGGHIVNVGSMGAFISGPNAGVYTASKFGLRGLSECLRYNLAPHGIGVSLVSPGLTRSRIYEAPLHRPPQFGGASKLDERSIGRLAAIHAVGMDPEEVGRKTLDGILQNRFYVFPHQEFRSEVMEEHAEIMRAMPSEEHDPVRLTVETARRGMKARARDAVEQLNVRERVASS